MDEPTNEWMMMARPHTFRGIGQMIYMRLESKTDRLLFKKGRI